MSAADGMPSLVSLTLTLDLRGGQRRLNSDEVRNQLECAAFRAPANATVRVTVDADTPHPIEVDDLGLDRVTRWQVESASRTALINWGWLLNSVRT